MRRAIGVIRVSERKGRKGESFVSPKAQADGMRRVCNQRGYELVDLLDEVDVSGGLALAKRRGMGPAVSAIEAGQADVVLVHAFDRLVRNLGVQREIVDRVEAAGGIVLAGDFGEVSHKTAIKRLTSSLIGAVHEYYRESIREKSAEAQAHAVARGVLPYPNVPPGYLRGPTGQLVPDPATRKVVAEAFRLRATGATLKEVRAYLANQGIARSYHGVQALMRSRVVLGEIHFGDLSNLHAHEPIVDPDTFAQVQRVIVPRGRRAKSFRLLARLGVLRCGTCGSRMVVGTGFNGRYNHYRCPPVGDCPRRVTISAEIAEQVVTDAVRAALADLEGRASAQEHVRQAEREAERAQADLDAALRAFGGLVDEPAAAERLAQLAGLRDRAAEHLEQLGGTRASLTINTATDWDRLTSDAQRTLIRAVVKQVTVAPGGKGADRISVELVGQ